MATRTIENRCRMCKTNNATSLCIGCSQKFCFTHFVQHREDLNRKLDHIEQDRDLFQQTLNQQTTNIEKDLLIQQVDHWEGESIQKIKQAAQEIKQFLINHSNKNIAKVELDQLTQQIKHCRKENDIVENDLQRWEEKLKEMKQQLNKPSNIVIQQTEIPLIKKIQAQVLRGEFPKIIALRSNSNGKFVCAENAGNNPLIANRGTASIWETFDLIHLNGDKFALKSHANGMYVCAEIGGFKPLIANRTKIESWETFQLVDCGNGKVAFIAVNGKYVCAENNGNRELIANRTKIASCETFDLVEQ